MYIGLSATLSHVSGEWWYAHKIMGVSCWLTDEALKVHFVVASDGRVQGMELQTEPDMPELMAFFDRLQ